MPTLIQYRRYLCKQPKEIFMSEIIEEMRLSFPMKGIPQPTRSEVLNLPRVYISTHPVMQHKMTALRAKNTAPPAFYRLVKEMGALLAYEATARLLLEDEHIETPLQAMTGQRLAGAI